MTHKLGFTLVEVVIGVSIFLVVSLGVYQAYTSLYASLTNSHLKVVVSDLANERFEIIRNLSYANVGIVGGTPSGTLLGSQELVRDGFTWNVLTMVTNFDDPFDGLSPTDTKPADYKLVELTLSCQGCRNFPPVTINGIVSPRNLEP